MPTLSQEIARSILTMNSGIKREDAAKAAPPAPQPESPAIIMPSSQNPAVLRCILAYNKAYRADIQQGMSSYIATSTAERAYRQSLPSLVGQDNITDFIDCIAQGMLIDAIPGSDGARLLYAAQVALLAQKGGNRKTHRKSQSENTLDLEKEEK